MRAVLSVWFLILGMAIAAPGQAYAPEDVPTARNGGPEMGVESHEEVITSLDLLADDPHRPHWAPLPTFREDAGIAPLLHALLASTDDRARARSAFLLGQIGSPASVELLAERLDDPSREVRVHSGIALACMGDERGIPTCAAVLQADPPWIRYYAVCGLWAADSPRAKSLLKVAARGRDKLVGPAARAALSTPYTAPPPPSSSGTKIPLDSPPDEVWLAAADVFVREADWWWHAGDYDQAIRCLEAVLFMDPLDVERYAGIAWLQWSMGRDREAIRTLNRGIAAAPTNPDAHFELGFHYFRTGRNAQAETHLRRALELNAGLIVRRAYAHCLERLGKLEESIEQWSIILAAQPEDLAARRNLDRVRRLLESGEQPVEQQDE